MSSKPPNPQPDKSVSQQVALQVTQIQWSGPLPTPDALEHFERVIPGGASRILSMAEQEQAHRFETQKKVLGAQIADTKRGQILGAIIGIIAVGGAVWNGIAGGHWQVSVALVGVPVLGMIQAIARRVSKSQEQRPPT